MYSSGLLLPCPLPADIGNSLFEAADFFLGYHFNNLLSFGPPPFCEMLYKNPLRSLSFDYFFPKSILLCIAEIYTDPILDLDFVR
jgi:hypothetical protein